MKRSEIDARVAEILEAFALDQQANSASWQRQLGELRRIVAADYDEAVDRLLRSGEPNPAELLKRARHEFPDFNRQPLTFSPEVRQTIADRGIQLHLGSRHTSPGLRGFYHREAGRGPLIWVNLAHPPGAVAASLGHELGHWYREQLIVAQNPSDTRVFFNGRFTDHLEAPDELFADLFPVLAAYPRPLALKLFPRQRGIRATLEHVLELDRATIARIRAHLTDHYGFDPAQTEQPPPRRLYYLGSMLHFARLRRALLDRTSL